MIDKYLSFDVETQLMLVRNETIEFPAVTVCNQMLAPFDYKQICEKTYMALEKFVWFYNFLNNTPIQNVLLGVLNRQGYDLVASEVRQM
jgi:hypothetical protein